MTFTGERFVPNVRGSIALEHRHRYIFSRSMAAGKRVLDVACGEGYGSAILAEVAAKVAGIDIDEETIARACVAYPSANITFAAAPCSRLPFGNDEFDVAVCFETIEHVDADDQERLLAEIARVLAPGGVLVVSTPNKLVYTDRPDYHNPFHLQELYVEEFRTLLQRYFPTVTLYGQRVAASSLLFRETECDDRGSIFESSLGEFTDDATYVVALCGPASVSPPLPSAYFNTHDDTLADMQAEVVRRERELRELQAEYAKLEGGYYALLAENRDVKAARTELETYARSLEARSLGTSPFRNAFTPLPSLEETTLERERDALRSWTSSCRNARLDSARTRVSS